MTNDIEGAIRKILEKLVKPGCADRTIDSALSAILCLNAKLGGIGDCDVCWTSSWMTVPKDTPNAQQVNGKDEWVLCQMCEADRKIIKLATKSELNEKEVENILLSEFDKRGQYFKAEINNVAKVFTSHFSKPVIKYPEKKEVVVSEYKGKPIIMSKERQQEFKEDLGMLIGYNQAIDDMKRLNGEGV